MITKASPVVIPEPWEVVAEWLHARFTVTLSDGKTWLASGAPVQLIGPRLSGSRLFEFARGLPLGRRNREVALAVWLLPIKSDRTQLLTFSYEPDTEVLDSFLAEVACAWPEAKAAPEHTPAEPVPGETVRRGGNPGLSREERAKRLAMAMRAEFIKSKAMVPMTWEDVVIEVKWSYGTTTASRVRLLGKARKELAELREQGDPDRLLDEAKRLYEELYPRTQPQTKTN